MARSFAFDLIVVGSGPSGAHAAAAAVERGVRVALIDIGDRDEKYSALIPQTSFTELRRSDSNQHRYFLGDACEGVSVGAPKTVPHITPPHAYMTARSEALFPLRSENFFPLQSSARGGLAAAWGGNCFALEDFELRRAGLPAAEVRALYPVVARSIGVSASPGDDLTPFIGGIEGVQPPLDIDTNARSVLSAYERRRAAFHSRGCYLGRSMLAVLSQDLGSRHANAYHDMDYWSDHGESVYRPEYTLRELRAKSNFQELARRLVLRFHEPRDGGIELICRNLADGNTESVAARKLALAAGALGSARLVLSSLGHVGVRAPLLCNPNRKLAAVNLRMLGRPAADRRYSFSQLTLLMTLPHAPEDYLVGQVFSYRSLLYFRLIQDIPLPPWLALQFLRLIGTSLTMVNLHHSDRPSTEKWIELAQHDGRDELRAHYALTPQENAAHAHSERRLLANLLRLGCVPLKMSYSEHGGSVHYGGTLPYSPEPRALTCDSSGRLRQTRNVFVADSSTWNFLPAKGLTFTLMANARRVAAEAAREIAQDKVRAA